MQAIQVYGFEGTHQWTLEEATDPVPGPSDVLVQIETTAISYVDLLFARGGYQIKPLLPVIPGTEFCGRILSCGEDVNNGLCVGQRITGTSLGGAWAQRLRVNANSVVPVPTTVDTASASALAVTYATALYALKQRGSLKSGETVLVLGATGGVGLAAIQVARALGARVIAGASGEIKVKAALELGADYAIDTSKTNWRDLIKHVEPQGLDVVLDPVGGDLLEPAFRSLKWNGRYLVVGFADGTIPSLRANLPLLKGAALIGVDIRQFREREPEAHWSNLTELVDLVSAGKVNPFVAKKLPVSQWLAAIQIASERSTIGRVVMDWTFGNP